MVVAVLDIWEDGESEDNRQRFLISGLNISYGIDSIPTAVVRLVIGEPLSHTKDMASLRRGGASVVNLYFPEELIIGDGAIKPFGTIPRLCAIRFLDEFTGKELKTIFQGVVINTSLEIDPTSHSVRVICQYKAAMLSMKPLSATSAIVNPGFMLSMLQYRGDINEAAKAQQSKSTLYGAPLFDGSVSDGQGGRIDISNLNCPISERIGRMACAIIDSENYRMFSEGAATNRYSGLIGECLKGSANLSDDIWGTDPTGQYNKSMWDMLRKTLREGATLYDAMVAVLTSPSFMLHVIPRVAKSGCEFSLEVCPSMMWSERGSRYLITDDNVQSTSLSQDALPKDSTDVFLVRCDSGTALAFGDMSANTMIPGIYSPDKELCTALRDAYRAYDGAKVLELSRTIDLQVVTIEPWQLIAAQEKDGISKSVHDTAARAGTTEKDGAIANSKVPVTQVEKYTEMANKIAEYHYANSYKGRSRMSALVSPSLKFGGDGIWLEDLLGHRVSIMYNKPHTQGSFVGRLVGISYTLERTNKVVERYQLDFDSVFHINNVPDTIIASPYTL